MAARLSVARSRRATRAAPTWLPKLGDSLYTLSAAPGRRRKAGTSRGEPYGIIVPDGYADALITSQTTMPFVDYLNRVSRNG